MSIFVALLAFPDPDFLAAAKLGVLVGSGGCGLDIVEGVRLRDAGRLAVRVRRKRLAKRYDSDPKALRTAEMRFGRSCLSI